MLRFFFKSTRFKVILAIAGGIIILMIIARALSGWASPQSGIIGAIVTPIQRFTASVSETVKDKLSVYSQLDDLKKQNEALKVENREKNSKIIDYNEIKQENETLRAFYDIKEKNADFNMINVKSVSYDLADPFKAFTIDKGSLDDIAPGDPVITPDGLVGFVKEAAPTYSLVVTVLSPDIKAAVIDSHTQDSGVISGNLELAEKGSTRMSYISRQSAVAVGDIISTSGVGGVFPKGLVVGTVQEVRPETADISRYAVIKPAVKFEKLEKIMVITSFNGQK